MRPVDGLVLREGALRLRAAAKARLRAAAICARL